MRDTYPTTSDVPVNDRRTGFAPASLRRARKLPTLALPAVRALAPVLLLASALALAPAAQAQPQGLPPRVANTALIIDEAPPTDAATVALEPAFARLGFTDLVALVEIPDGSGRMVALERTGQVWTFPRIADPDPATDLVLMADLAPLIGIVQTELGLLSIAFAPDYASSGRIFVYYTATTASAEFPFYDSAAQLVRFDDADPTDDTFDPAARTVLLDIDQPWDHHVGGTLAFGPDGMLYLSIGDGGGGACDGRSQDPTNLRGSVVRLDVTGPPDPGLAYAIPPDNPFAAGGPVPGTRAEIWAWGLRNPWRCSFDAVTGALLCGDVGGRDREEINHITAGANYGWPLREGSVCFVDPDSGLPCDPACDPTGLTDPVREHIRPDSIAVIGGHVYRGSAIPGLAGTYVYADFVSGNLWGLDWNGTSATNERTLATGVSTVHSLAEDADGELYILHGWGIERLVAAGDPEPSSFPTRLGDIPALLAAGLGQDQTHLGIYAYAPRSALWSDGVRKERFFALPGLATIDYTAEGGWGFPDGSVLIKNFLVPDSLADPASADTRVETRLLVRAGGNWHGASFRWTADGADAVLLAGADERTLDILGPDGAPLAFTWRFPSRSDCGRCHTDVAGGTLGLSTAQMNHDFDYAATGVRDNQLRALENAGLFSDVLPAEPEDLPRSPDVHDEDADLEDRALSYLHANCSMCHQTGGPTPVSLDLAWGRALAERGLVDAAPGAGDLGIADARIVAPGAPERSLLLARMEDLGVHRMPPLATSLVDEAAVDVVRRWIEDLDPVCPAEPAACTEADASALRIDDRSPDGRDRLRWQWQGAPVDVGDALAGTSWALCVYDEVGGVPVLRTRAAAHAGAAWKTSGGGSKYKGAPDTPGGVRKLDIRADGTRVKLVAKGNTLPTPRLPLAQDANVLVQLISSDAGCFQATLAAPARTNTSERFEDR